jgi:hypothetical protein
MSVRIRIEPILLKKKLFDVPAGQAAKEQALGELAEEARELFQKTTATWETQPVFIVRINQNNTSVTTASKIYTYIDKGTRVRYATMSPDFSPKTRSRVIGSTAGKGRMIFVSRNHPRPGIQAREFSVIIQERMQKKFSAKFKRVIKTYISGEAPGL